MHAAFRLSVVSPRQHPVLSFGGMLNGGRLLHGGAVKLIHLRDAFECNEESFNLLYLVSSAHPAFAEDLLKRCQRLKISIVWNQNGVAYPAWAGNDVERYNHPMRRFRAMADFVIYQSAFCRDSAERFLGPCEAASEIIFNPVDLQKFRPAATPLPAEPLRLLTLGTHGYAQRVLATLRCARLLKDSGVDCLLTIAGQLGWPGGLAQTRREIGKLRLKERVTWCWHRSPRRKPRNSIEITIFCSIRNILIPVRPSSSRPSPPDIPVVASGSGGLPEMVPASCGELIPAPVSWEKLIPPTGEATRRGRRALLPRLQEAASAARSHAEATYDSAKWVARHAGIFRRLLA